MTTMFGAWEPRARRLATVIAGVHVIGAVVFAAFPQADLAVSGWFADGARGFQLPRHPVLDVMLVAVDVISWTFLVGATLGCRFVGYPLAQVGRTILHGAVAGAIMVAFALAASVLLAQATGIRLATILLGFAPGGLAEMSLVAIALGVDAAFVATHHLARIVLVVLCATPLFRILGLRR